MTAHAAVLREAAGGGAARKGGTPGEGSPFDPLLRFFEHWGRSARCGARPGARPLDPARFFVKKRGKKLLKGYVCAGHTCICLSISRCSLAIMRFSRRLM